MLFAAALPQRKVAPSELILMSAAKQASVGAVYDASYQQLRYPNGDIDSRRGCCADVLIRALRAAGLDLQRLVYLDAGRSPSSYPAIRKRDKNIDHRRVRNLVVFFERHGKRELDIAPRSFKPAEFVYWKLPNGRDHIGIVTAGIGASGNHKVVHNLSVCCEEDCLASYRIVGRFRYPVEK